MANTKVIAVANQKGGVGKVRQYSTWALGWLWTESVSCW